RAEEVEPGGTQIGPKLDAAPVARDRRARRRSVPLGESEEHRRECEQPHRADYSLMSWVDAHPRRRGLRPAWSPLPSDSGSRIIRVSWNGRSAKLSIACAT